MPIRTGRCAGFLLDLALSEWMKCARAMGGQWMSEYDLHKCYIAASYKTGRRASCYYEADMKRRFNRHMLWAVPAAVTLLVAVQRPLTAQDTATQPSAAFRPIAPKIELMEWQDRAFSAMRLAIAKKKPTVAEHAWLLAELANVNRYYSDKMDYRAWAAAVRDGAAEIAKAAEDKKFDRAKELAKTIGDTCTSCHDKYQ